MPPRIAPAITPDDLAAVAGLLRAYAAALPIDLGYQGFEDEIAALPGKYAAPAGVLLLARDASPTHQPGRPLGCVALRPLPDSGACEMKRLYLAPEARGTGLGRALALALVQAARAAGHRELRLDTLPSMTAAIALYESLGFRPIAPYYAPTPDGTVFLGLTL